MKRFDLHLNDAEAEALETAATECNATVFDYLRAMIYRVLDPTCDGGSSSARKNLRRALRSSAQQGRRIASPSTPGMRRGYDADDYRKAIAEAGSLSGAARALGVHRSTVREMVDLYEIDVPTLH